MSIPYVVPEEVWNAKAATATVELRAEFERCEVTVVEVTTTGFSGTLDIKGKLSELNAFSNIPYVRQDQAAIQTPSVSQISWTTDTSIYRYVILGYWRRLQLVMTRSAGSITCGVVGSSSARAFPWLTKDGVVSWDGATATSGAIAKAVNPAAKFRLLGMTVHINTAGTTSENFTATLDAGDGAAYDVVLVKRDLSVGAVTDQVWSFGKGYEFEADDHIDIAWPNTENRTYGLRAIYELI